MLSGSTWSETAAEIKCSQLRYDCPTSNSKFEAVYSAVVSNVQLLLFLYNVILWDEKMRIKTTKRPLRAATQLSAFNCRVLVGG